MSDKSLEIIEKTLTKDLKEAAKSLHPSEVRYLVDLYYQMQEYRKATNNQVRSTEKEQKEPNTLLAFFAGQFHKLEPNIRKIMDIYSDNHPIGVWAKDICGIGPVIAAGLLAHIDIKQAPTAGHIWRYAGLDPTSKWEKGKKRPWNASLKVLCWKIGESFVKVMNNPADVYGKMYKERKDYEQAKNDAGEYREQALEKKDKVSKSTEAYKHYAVGKLPPGHIHARAKRYAVKMFLSHFHAEWYRMYFKEEPPKPYPIAILGHAHERKVA